ncbi:MAG: hypothetical protein KDD47_08680 [Acidobacteria bacterium]|nr:hypothetical protein [Acidobacteriota bacterium]
MASSSTPLGYWDYLKEAFKRKPRVPLLGRIPLNGLALAAFAVLGLANPGFWFLGAAGEAAFLLLVAGNERFQKLIEAERLVEARRQYEAKLRQSVSRLSRPSQERYGRLLDQCREVMGISETLEGSSGGLNSLRTGSLNQLLSIFLRLLSSREVIQQNMSRVERKALEADIQRLEKQLREAPPESPLVRSLGGTLEIQKRRLENLDRALDSLRVINAEMERIEQQVVLIREESAVGGKAELLSDRLDSVTSTLQETNRWMEQNAELIGDLGGSLLDETAPELGELPRILESEGSP